VAKILIVDDEPINRELLHAYLDGSGHALFEAATGEQALALAREVEPDLVLLDVMMPGLNGFDTAKRLKQLASDQFLPVVLVTALSDHGSRLEGLGAGADEFLTKPIDRHELTLRIANLLALRDKEAALTRRNLELVELQRFREEMSTMIVHDLKNPLTAVIANLEFAIDDSRLDAETLDALRDSKTAAHRAVRLIANLLDVARMEERQLRLRRSLVSVVDLVGPLVHQRLHAAGARSISIDSAVDGNPQMNADSELIGRVIENVFDNALRYTPVGGRIAVRGSATDGAVRLTIGNSGTAIPLEARTRIFEKYAQSDQAVGRMNLGLGLYFCRLAAEAHGGRMWVEETAELPTVFALELPA
jgi:two-component system, sensor histidine kinase and response regulator